MTITYYIIIFAAILVFLIFIWLRVFTKKCEKCGSKLSNDRKHISDVRSVGKFHKHSRLDGEKDRRFKYNSTDWVFFVTFVCPDCRAKRVERVTTKNGKEISFLYDKSKKTSKKKSHLEKEIDDLETILKDL